MPRPVWRNGLVLLILLCWPLADVAAEGPAGSGPAKKPNIIFILADDFSTNLVQYMPNLQQMMRDGTSFSNYFVTNSLCCPSRSSILTGKFPHNTHVLTNTRPDGGYAGFNANGNQQQTIALALQRAGYRTAMLGKYLNGYQPKANGVPPGWDDWHVAGNGYPEFDYDLNENGQIVHHGRAPEDYLTDVLAASAEAFIRKSGNAPFFIEIATFAPHAPYTPAPRDAEGFPGLKAPRTAAFAARPDANAPKWLQEVPALTPAEMTRIDRVFRLRVQSVQAIDRMIGQLRTTLAAMAADSETYVVFSSDNGLHLGEYSMRPGKMTPYEIDIHLPLVVVGPGVAKGHMAEGFAENVDLAPTFAEIGHASEPLVPDGHSLVALFAGDGVEWRQSALIEHHRPARFDKADPDAPEHNSENPTSYAAMRLKTALYVEYEDGEAAYYDLTDDPEELRNVVAALSSAERQKLHDQLVASRTCRGTKMCWDAQRLLPVSAAEAPAGPRGNTGGRTRPVR